MFYNKQNNQYIIEGNSFVLNDIQYPAIWLTQATQQQKEEIGLVEVETIGYPEDAEFFWISTKLEDGKLIHTSQPKDLTKLKEAQLAKVDSVVYSLLSQSDWMLIRQLETGKPVADAWKQYRAAVRQVADEATASINNATDMESLRTSCKIDWPTNPEVAAPPESI